MLRGRQRELLRVFGSGREAAERALQRGANGRVRQRLRRELRVGARSRIIVQRGMRVMQALACVCAWAGAPTLERIFGRDDSCLRSRQRTKVALSWLVRTVRMCLEASEVLQKLQAKRKQAGESRG